MSTQQVTVNVPSPTLMSNPQYGGSGGGQWGGPGYPIPVPYIPPPTKEVWQDCEGAIVEGGALEIRLVDQNGDYDVVRGYGPLGYLSFVNEQPVEGDPPEARCDRYCDPQTGQHSHD